MTKSKEKGRRSRGWVALAAVVVIAAALSGRPDSGEGQKAPSSAVQAGAGQDGTRTGTEAPDTTDATDATVGAEPASGAPHADAGQGAPSSDGTAGAAAGREEGASAGEAQSPAPTPAQTLQATVQRVVDGDTVDVLVDGREERVRLIGVDTPEVYGKAEAYGAEASAFTKQRLTGQEVRLELDVEERDRYGRLLAYVWIGDEMFNETLVREGYAQVMTVPPNVKYADRFVALQREAREHGRGLWGLEEASGSGAGVAASGGTASGGAAGGSVLPVNGDCGGLIKGNVSSSGELIYHVPGGQFYDRTRAEACFATPEEAEAAGYRRSRR